MCLPSFLDDGLEYKPSILMPKRHNNESLPLQTRLYPRLNLRQLLGMLKPTMDSLITSEVGANGTYSLLAYVKSELIVQGDASIRSIETCTAIHGQKDRCIAGGKKIRRS